MHFFGSARQIVRISLITSQSSRKSDSRIHCNCASEWICETSVSSRAVRVTSSAIGFIPDRFGLGVHRRILNTRIRSAVNFWKELAVCFLLARFVHRPKTSIIIVNISVSATTIDAVADAMPVLIEVCDRGFFGAVGATKLGIA